MNKKRHFLKVRPLSGLVLALATTALVAVAAPAKAALIDVQFYGAAAQTGAAVTGSAGDIWNQVGTGTAGKVVSAPSGSQSLLASTGAGSGLSLTYSAGFAYTAQPSFTKFTGTPYQNLMQGILITPLQLTIAGLTAGQTFSLYAYTQGDNNSAGRRVGLTVNGQSQTTTQTNASTFILGNNYAVFTGVANALGQITITGASGGEGDLNGLQLVTNPVSASAVPEPASFAIVGAGLVAIISGRAFSGLAFSGRAFRKRAKRA